MESILHLFDLMPFVHAGHVNKRSFLSKLQFNGASWETLETPTGGVSLLFNQLYNVVGHGDVVVCSDRNPTIKKEMCPGYKGNREHRNDIQVDKASAEYILQKCQVPLFAQTGYEADDIIYTIIKSCYNNYDKIYVYTGDSDLYFLVDDKVSIKPSSSRAKEITRENYETAIYKDGCIYNTCTFLKILYGDTSDCIPKLPSEVAQEMIRRCGIPALVRDLGKYTVVKNLFDHIYPQYSYQVDTVFPLIVPETPTEFTQPDIDMIRNFGAAIKNKYFAGRMSPNFNVEPFVEDMCSKGIYLLKEGY